MLIKRTERQTRRSNLAATVGNQAAGGLDRRSFLRRSGLVATGLATIGALPLATVRKAEAAAAPMWPARRSARVFARIVRSAAPSPPKYRTASGSARSRAGICRSTAVRIAPKAQSVRELVSRRAPAEISDEAHERAVDSACRGTSRSMRSATSSTAIREKSGSDSVYWLGSAKMTNEGSYLFRKLGAFWGTNNTDHQARICHSTTVTGVANTWGYGAMTNSYTDIRNAKTQIIMGGNPAEAHPVSLQHLLEGAEMQQGERHRHRSATDAHRGACHRICAHPARHRYSGAVRNHVAHHQERLGGQGVHPAARLRLRGRAQGNGEVESGRGRARVPAFRARSSSASPRCSRRKSRRR